LKTLRAREKIKVYCGEREGAICFVRGGQKNPHISQRICSGFFDLLFLASDPFPLVLATPLIFSRTLKITNYLFALLLFSIAPAFGQDQCAKRFAEFTPEVSLSYAKAPYELRQFRKELAKTLLEIPQNVALKFVDKLDLEKLRPPGTRPPELDFPYSKSEITESLEKPVPLYNKVPMFHGGIALYQGDVFLEGNFRTKLVLPLNPNSKKKSLRPGDLVGEQPWFEWRAMDQKFAFHETGAQERLISRLPEKNAMLYRGGTPFDLALYRSIQRLRRSEVPLDSDWMELQKKKKSPRLEQETQAAPDLLARLSLEDRKALGDQLAEAYWKDLEEQKREGIFLSPHQEGALGWAEPVLFKLPVNRESLLRHSRAGDLYAGVEYDYTEIAFLSRELWNEFLQKVEVEKIKTGN
jgi:hypothetical protein